MPLSKESVLRRLIRYISYRYRWKLGILLCLLGLTMPELLRSQSSDVSVLSYPLFESDEILEISMEMNIRKVLRDRGEETDYHPLTVSWTNKQGELKEVAARVKVRGNFRRQRENCRFPAR